MNILLDKIRYNILRVNRILDLNVHKYFFNTTEFKSKINGEVEFILGSKGSNAREKFQEGEVQIYDSLLFFSHESTVKYLINSHNGHDGKYLSAKTNIKKDDTIKIYNKSDMNNNYIIDPELKINNKILQMEKILEADNRHHRKSPNYGMITSLDKDAEVNEIITGETYRYTYKNGLSPNGKEPTIGGRVGSFKFKYIGTDLSNGRCTINVLNKEPNGVAFPHGEVILVYKLEIDKIDFEDKTFKK